jgi:hypothetical protein
MKKELLFSTVVCTLLSLCVATPVFAGWFTLPDEALISSEFAKAWGPATYTRTDITGPGVLYEFTGLTGSGTALKDDYPVLGVYGQTGGSDFTNFTSYRVSFENRSSSGYVHVNIFMNTGYTSGTDGGHTHSGICDTFWEDGWVYLEAGTSVDVILDFAGSTAWNISDNPTPHSIGSPDGGIYEMNMYDRGQVTSIGFQVADFSGGGSPNASVVVRAYEEPVPVQTGTWGMVKALYRQ